MTMAEKAQAEQSGIVPDERRADITAAYRSADSPAAFRQALLDADVLIYNRASSGQYIETMIEKLGLDG